MTTITEDYVSFETAKLLKEKGFDQNCATYYLDGQVYHHYYGEVIPKDKQIYAAPTQAMAMKWLREVHHLLIDVGFGNDYKGEFLYMGDIYDLTKEAINAKYKPIIEANDYIVDNPKTYEEACEAAIKYCLEHLI